MQFITLDIIGVPKRSQLMRGFDSALEAIDMHPAGYHSQPDRDGEGLHLTCSAEFGYISLRSFPQCKRVFVDMLLPLSLDAKPFIHRFKQEIPGSVVKEQILRIRGAVTHREYEEAFIKIVSGGLEIPASPDASQAAADHERQGRQGEVMSNNPAEDLLERRKGFDPAFVEWWNKQPVRPISEVIQTSPMDHAAAAWTEAVTRVKADCAKMHETDHLRIAELESAYSVRNDEVTGLSGMLEEARTELLDLRAFRQCVTEAIPQTLGEFVMQHRFEPPCESHEYDNRTTAENADWLMTVLRQFSLATEGLEIERDNWEQTAAQHARNEAFYRDLLMQCAAHLGKEVYISDDGSVQDEPLALKVPELVEELASSNTRLKAALQAFLDDPLERGSYCPYCEKAAYDPHSGESHSSDCALAAARALLGEGKSR